MDVSLGMTWRADYANRLPEGNEMVGECRGLPERQVLLFPDVVAARTDQVPAQGEVPVVIGINQNHPPPLASRRISLVVPCPFKQPTQRDARAVP